MRTISAVGLLLAVMLLSVNVQASKPISGVTLFMASNCILDLKRLRCLLPYEFHRNS